MVVVVRLSLWWYEKEGRGVGMGRGEQEGPQGTEESSQWGMWRLRLGERQRGDFLTSSLFS